MVSIESLLSRTKFRILSVAELDRREAEHRRLLVERDALRAEREVILRDRIALELERDALRAEREVILRDRIALELDRDALRTERTVILDDRIALERERDLLRIDRQILLEKSEGYRIRNEKAEQCLIRYRSAVAMNNLISSKFENILSLVDQSKSQFAQDLFVLSVLGIKRNGFFVEFGATDGISISNTYLLEKSLGWTGILAEPARCWHSQLTTNRNARIDFSCVWTESGSTLMFNETHLPELSTILNFSDRDFLRGERTTGQTYEVSTISLLDLLEKHSAPRIIDYLSIDTEGSEFEILNAFDFSKYEISVITCEHNFSPERDRIYELLRHHGYRRVFEELSSVDDWYVKDDK